jgi:hypothetical protein
LAGRSGNGILLKLLECASMKWNRTIVLSAVAAFVLVAAAIFGPRMAESLRSLFAPKSYDWVSRTMAACEEDAVTQPATLNFLVVPLEPSRRYNQEMDSKALETVGRTTLFGSQDALAGLSSGALRISSKNFVLHTLDTSNNAAHRWNSASGVSRLSSNDITSDGPFRIRFQTSPNDASSDWSKVTAEGRGTCHWAFVLLRD